MSSITTSIQFEGREYLDAFGIAQEARAVPP